MPKVSLVYPDYRCNILKWWNWCKTHLQTI